MGRTESDAKRSKLNVLCASPKSVILRQNLKISEKSDDLKSRVGHGPLPPPPATTPLCSVQENCSKFNRRLCVISRAHRTREGYLVNLSDGDLPSFRVSFSPIWSRTGYQKKEIFLKLVVNTRQKRKYC